MMSEHSDLKLSIEGHTDNVGADAANLALSAKRAAAVKASLVSQFGVDGARLTPGGDLVVPYLKDVVKAAPDVERAIVHSGVILLKYWLEVGPEEQTRRLESRINDPRKIWKLSDLDLKSYSRWNDYSHARDEMFRATETWWAPCTASRSKRWRSFKAYWASR